MWLEMTGRASSCGCLIDRALHMYRYFNRNYWFYLFSSICEENVTGGGWGNSPPRYYEHREERRRVLGVVVPTSEREVGPISRWLDSD
jgi:hypothetical protein